MSRQPHDIANVNLRIRETLRAKLERAAHQHRFSLNNEIRLRLEDSFERHDIARALSDIVDDLQINWARYGHRFLRLRLEDELAEAIARTNDLAQIRTLARLWLNHRDQERRLVEEHRGQERRATEGGVS